MQRECDDKSFTLNWLKWLVRHLNKIKITEWYARKGNKSELTTQAERAHEIEEEEEENITERRIKKNMISCLFGINWGTYGAPIKYSIPALVTRILRLVIICIHWYIHWYIQMNIYLNVWKTFLSLEWNMAYSPTTLSSMNIDWVGWIDNWHSYKPVCTILLIFNRMEYRWLFSTIFFCCCDKYLGHLLEPILFVMTSDPCGEHVRQETYHLSYMLTNQPSTAENHFSGSTRPEQSKGNWIREREWELHRNWIYKYL